MFFAGLVTFPFTCGFAFVLVTFYLLCAFLFFVPIICHLLLMCTNILFNNLFCPAAVHLINLSFKPCEVTFSFHKPESPLPLEFRNILPCFFLFYYYFLFYFKTYFTLTTTAFLLSGSPWFHWRLFISFSRLCSSTSLCNFYFTLCFTTSIYLFL